MATYRFDQFEVDIENPNISVHPKILELHTETMLAKVQLTMSIEGAAFGLVLDDVVIASLDQAGLTGQGLEDAVMTKLEEFEV